MFIANLDPLAFGMAGIALLLSLISLLIIVFYLRKLVLASMRMADAFMAVLEAHGYFEDDDEGDNEEDTIDPPDDPHTTAPLPDELDNESSSSSEEENEADIEAEAELALIFRRMTREEDLILA